MPEEIEMIGPAGTFTAPKAQEKKYAHDIYVQCTRCRSKHMESDRVKKSPDRHGMRIMACPKCGGHSYYKLDDNGKCC
jgi:predicted nucleic-acid-binding Zn-ribbon protein